MSDELEFELMPIDTEATGEDPFDGVMYCGVESAEMLGLITSEEYRDISYCLEFNRISIAPVRQVRGFLYVEEQTVLVKGTLVLANIGRKLQIHESCIKAKCKGLYRDSQFQYGFDVVQVYLS